MLRVSQQLYLAGVEAPTAARRLRVRSAAWLATYVGAAAGVLALVAWQLVKHKDDLLQLALDYVVPQRLALRDAHAVPQVLRA